MPHLDGVDVCREVRRRRAEPYLYTVLLTARDDKDDVLRGLDAGADDYLIKPCSSFDLQVRLRAGKSILALRDQVRDLQQEMEVRLMTNASTCAFNRLPFLDLLKRELSRSQRSGAPASLVLANVDDLRQFEPERDTETKCLLRQVVERFSGVVRSYDMLGDLGAGQFALLLPECEVERGVEVAARLQYALSSTPLAVGSRALRVTASYGVASTSQRPGARMEQLLRSATQAMLRARGEGRNRVRVALVQEWLDSEKALAASSAPAA
jgi:diguanylate cyclase (GGDEF)-like protein